MSSSEDEGHESEEQVDENVNQYVNQYEAAENLEPDAEVNISLEANDLLNCR